jgi:hypothetical protein
MEKRGISVRDAVDDDEETAMATKAVEMVVVRKPGGAMYLPGAVWAVPPPILIITNEAIGFCIYF